MYNNGNNNSGNGQYALVSDTRAYSGSKSVHFKAGASPAQIVRALPAGVNTLYMKAQVYMAAIEAITSPELGLGLVRQHIAHCGPGFRQPDPGIGCT